jgi:hypothetical protein
VTGGFSRTAQLHDVSKLVNFVFPASKLPAGDLYIVARKDIFKKEIHRNGFGISYICTFMTSIMDMKNFLEL